MKLAGQVVGLMMIIIGLWQGHDCGTEDYV
jgi:hypothetical protein